MSAYVDIIRPRDSAANSVAAFIEFTNTLINAITQSGMIRLSESELAGQSGTLVNSTTPGAGETSFTALGVVAATSSYDYGFRHPTLGFVIRVRVIEQGSTGGGSYLDRWAKVIVAVAHDVDGNGSLLNPTVLESIYTTIFYSIPLSTISASYKALVVSCDDDHFWIYSAPHIFQHSTNDSNSTTWDIGASVVAVGVFAADDMPSVLLLLGQVAAIRGNNSEMYLYAPISASPLPFANSAAQCFLSREGGAFTRLGGAQVGYLQNTQQPTDANGNYRVQRAQLYVDGVRRFFNLGTVAMAAVSDAVYFNCDLTGDGAQDYCPVPGFLSAGPVTKQSTFDSSVYAVYMLPVAGTKS